jgi:enamine deaminase RidA (YjgF/YER057c/UK114 family)
MLLFVTDVAEYKASRRALGEVWKRRFGRHYPAIALLGVSALFDDAARVELVATAVIA